MFKEPLTMFELLSNNLTKFQPIYVEQLQIAHEALESWNEVSKNFTEAYKYWVSIGVTNTPEELLEQIEVILPEENVEILKDYMRAYNDYSERQP